MDKKKKKIQINDLVSYLCEEKKNIIRFFSDCDYSVEDEREFFFFSCFFFLVWALEGNKQ